MLSIAVVIDIILANEEFEYQIIIATMMNKLHEKIRYFFNKVNLINLERRIANIEYSKITNI